MTNIAIDRATDLKIDELAKLAKVPKQTLISDMLKRGIEDFEDLIEAMAISKKIKSGQEKVLSTSQMRKELGLED